MNKNEYEIRLEVLYIAHNDLMQVYHEKLNAENDPQLRAKLAKKLPTPEEIIARATALYSFVNTP